MLLVRFYKYAKEIPWFFRLNMIVGYLLGWFSFVLSLLMLLVIPSVPGYKTVIAVVLFGAYFYTLLRMRKEMIIEPEAISSMKIDSSTKEMLNKSLKNLL